RKIPDIFLSAEIRDVKKLKEEQLEIARNAFKIAEGQIKTGIKHPFFSLEYARRVLNAELDLASTKQERIAALQTYWRRTQDIEKFAKERSETGAIHSLDLLEAQFQRVKAEIRLLEEKAK